MSPVLLDCHLSLAELQLQGRLPDLLWVSHMYWGTDTQSAVCRDYNEPDWDVASLLPAIDGIMGSRWEMLVVEGLTAPCSCVLNLLRPEDNFSNQGQGPPKLQSIYNCIYYILFGRGVDCHPQTFFYTFISW